MINLKFVAILLFLYCSLLKEADASPFDLVTPKYKVTIYYDKEECRLDSIVANLLATDIYQVTGYLPAVHTDVSKAEGNIIMIGSCHSKLIQQLGKNVIVNSLKGKWECYAVQVLSNPFKKVKQALVVAGSDYRGTAYGVFHISQEIGVSPWYWWADAKPEVKKTLILNSESITSATPSVKYRGIFINDEDWGLQPWAAKTFEPETGDIGPKTYSKVFELLLRLKANFIWPAMHPSTKAFYHYPGNIKAAEDYQIVVGSSHAEPMLRNNVGEWDEKTMGHFNYITNQQMVDSYWESRVKESSRFNGIYTIGMRGVHDGAIEGVKTAKEAVPLLQKIFTNQRNMLSTYVNKDITRVPQAFTPYKEVLDVYDAGLQVPDDVTLVWPDDNYGYIQRLSNVDENTRKGGSGVYYHASYWGRPHDYLWLSTTHPSLMREEMTKAYAMNAKNIWVLNVGDIKPAEYNIQFFLDMAYRIEPFMNTDYPATHLQEWMISIFGKKQASAMANLLQKYYSLAFERKPEFMSWSQTEPTTPVKLTAYNHFSYGDQAQKRIDAYTELEDEVNRISSAIPEEKKATFYELIDYPVTGAALMNKKFLYHDKAVLYAKQGRLSAQQYDVLSKKAYQNIIDKTNFYNTTLSNGKWAGIMSMNPRKLPVYDLPVTTLPKIQAIYNWKAMLEGYTMDDSSVAKNSPDSFFLPAFNRWHKQQYFIDVFLTKEVSVNYTIETSATWIKVNQYKGKLLPQKLESQQRLWVEVDWTKAPMQQQLTGSIIIKSNDRQLTFYITVNNGSIQELKNYKGFIESNQYMIIPAADYSGLKNNSMQYWKATDSFGMTGQAMEALPLVFKPATNSKDTAAIRGNPSMEYEFYNFNKTLASFSFYTLPTAPLNKDFEMRYAVSIDNGPLTIFNYKTGGRSEEWKQNVLRNASIRTINKLFLQPGKHKLTIYMIDPAVIVQKIFIDLGIGKPFYGELLQNKN